MRYDVKASDTNPSGYGLFCTASFVVQCGRVWLILYTASVLYVLFLFCCLVVQSGRVWRAPAGVAWRGTA